jgi:hypothetical protein
MLFKEIIAIYSKNNTKAVSTHFRHNAELVYIQA